MKKPAAPPAMPAPDERAAALRQLGALLRDEQRQRHWEKRWARRLGLFFASLIGLFVVTMLLWRHLPA